jgi:phage gpG-like protein
MRFETLVQGQPELEIRLDQLAKELDPVKVLDQAAAILLNRIRARFLNELSTDGSPWTPSAAAIKRGGHTLFDTGNLFRSIQLFAESPTTRAIGTDVPYAGFLNFGTSILPPREFLGFSDDDISAVQAYLTNQYAKELV